MHNARSQRALMIGLPIPPSLQTPHNGDIFVIMRENTLISISVGVRSLSSQETWVNVEEGAEITGYHLDHVRRLARENWRLPEDERLIRIRKDGHAYAIWLPDLVSYFEGGNGDRVVTPDEEIWVNVKEGAETTGYSRKYIDRKSVV